MSGLRVGGTERQISILAPALLYRGHSVTVAVPFFGDHFEQGLRDAGVNVIAFRSHKTGRIPWDGITQLSFPLSVARLANSKRFDVIHGYGRTANIIASIVGRISHSKVIWGVRHSMPIVDWREKFANRVLTRAIDLVITNSSAGKAIYADSPIEEGRIQVVPNGIDTKRFRPEPDWRNETRAAFGLSRDDLLIGAVGRLTPEKDYETLLSSFTSVAIEHPSARLMIVGSGSRSYAESLKSLSRHLGIEHAVIWAGQRDDPERMLNSFDIFVSSSQSEGFPNVIAEAMSTEVPCVVTDVGDSADIIGELGHSVPSGDESGFAEAILSSIRELPTVRRSDLRRRIAEQYSVETMVDRTEQLLMSVRK
jgi:glycosyltransferase involved in cell wall biosynthesis